MIYSQCLPCLFAFASRRGRISSLFLESILAVTRDMAFRINLNVSDNGHDICLDVYMRVSKQDQSDHLSSCKKKPIVYLEVKAKCLCLKL